MPKKSSSILYKIAASEVSDYEALNNAENDPPHAEDWDASRTIRATVIRWLCVDHEAIRYVDPKGIRIRAAQIDGQLDLAYATVPVPLGFWKSAFPYGVNLVQASTSALAFSGSFNRGSGSIALDADGIQVNGSMFLRDGFRARGTVRLVGAMLTGDLIYNGGTFYNLNHDALCADRIHVRGSVYLHDGFHAEGEVSLVGATITRDLDCDGGVFHNAGVLALTAEMSTVGGRVFLRKGFQAEAVQVGSALFVSHGFRAEGGVQLMGARVGLLGDDDAGWPAQGNLQLDGFVYTGFAPDAPTDTKVRLAWLARQPSPPCRPQPYLQLAKVLQARGDEAGAKQVLIAKECAR